MSETRITKAIVGTEPCEQSGCQEMAICGFDWPGKPPSKACGKHGDHVRAIANALGFCLTVTRLPSVKVIDLTDDPTELRARGLEVEP